MSVKSLIKLSGVMWGIGKVTNETVKKDNREIFEEYEYNKPFRLPTMSHPVFGDLYITTKRNHETNKAERIAKELCDEINEVEDVEAIPVYYKEGVNSIRIKIKPMKNIKKSFKMERVIKYIVKNEETRIYPEGDKIVIEIPNKGKVIRYGDIINEKEYKKEIGKTIVPIGKNIEGETICGDIRKMPHMLVAGTTGSGKSVFINGIIASLLMKNKPYDMEMILVDPKMVEFRQYAELKYVKYITKTEEAIGVVAKLCEEMDKRYRIMAQNGCREIEIYNKKYPEYRFPRILLVIDEMADMMMDKKNGKKVERNLIRIAQKARACGIHMILATQRPSRDVITGLIKANIPTRVCLSVMSRTDSMIVLDQIGAEKLNGNGDMLYLNGLNNKKAERLQAGLITAKEINQLVISLALDNQPDYGDKFDWETKNKEIREYYGR